MKKSAALFFLYLCLICICVSADDIIRISSGAGSGSGDALTTNPLSQFAATTSLQLLGVLNDEIGTGAAVFATSPTLVTPNLGTPSAVVLTNGTGLPITGGGTGGTTAATARGALGVFTVIAGVPNWVNATLNPVDSTTYFINALDIETPISAHLGTNLFVPAGTVIRVCVMARCMTVNGSAEDVTLTVRKNGIDTTMTFTQDWNTSSFTNVACGTVNPFTTATNDYLTVKAVTPAWATNPEGMMFKWWAEIRIDQ